MKKIIVGEYDRYGYRVWDANSGKDCYAAGNCRCDSILSLDPGTSGTLPLRQIRNACIKTAREIAEEQHGIYGGVERADE